MSPVTSNVVENLDRYFWYVALTLYVKEGRWVTSCASIVLYQCYNNVNVTENSEITVTTVMFNSTIDKRSK